VFCSTGSTNDFSATIQPPTTGDVMTNDTEIRCDDYPYMRGPSWWNRRFLLRRLILAEPGQCYVQRIYASNKGPGEYKTTASMAATLQLNSSDVANGKKIFRQSLEKKLK
jgi:hypothetical protein